MALLQRLTQPLLGFSGMLLLAAEIKLELRFGLTLAQAHIDTRQLTGCFALTSLVRNLQCSLLQGADTEGTDQLADLQAANLEMLILLGNDNLVLLLDGIFSLRKGILLCKKGLLLVSQTVHLDASLSKLFVCCRDLHGLMTWCVPKHILTQERDHG